MRPVAQLTHKIWMSRALEQARAAADHGDVPVGAVVVSDGEVIAAAQNRREVDQDPTAHAEIIVIRKAAAVVGSWRLEGCSLYVTLEPCAMCAGAIVLARIPQVVFAAPDPKAGAAGSVHDLLRDSRLNHTVDVAGGVMEAESAELLRAFFRAARARSRVQGPRWPPERAATLPPR